MAIIKQMSRIQLKGISDSGTPFTVPTSIDFTDGTWTITDLAEREIGVNVGAEEMWVRINGNLHQVVLDSGTAFTQVNSDWTAVSGAAQILHKPTIPIAVSDLTQDVPYIQNIGGLVTTDGTVTITGAGTVASPYSISAGGSTLENRVFNFNIDTTTPISGQEFFRVHNTAEGCQMFSGTISLRETSLGHGYILTFRAVTEFIAGVLTTKVLAASSNDFNFAGNTVSVTVFNDGTDACFGLQAASAPLVVDLTLTYTPTNMTY